MNCRNFSLTRSCNKMRLLNDAMGFIWENSSESRGHPRRLSLASFEIIDDGLLVSLIDLQKVFFVVGKGRDDKKCRDNYVFFFFLSFLILLPVNFVPRVVFSSNRYV
jgi:hypothetical protein